VSWKGTPSPQIGFPLFCRLEDIALRKALDNPVVTGEKNIHL
jgi:hypothetical protein